MCKLSSQLKLCSCEASDVSKLESFWVLHRFDPRKNDMVIRRVMRADTLDPQLDTYNRSLLLQRLHEDDAFDVDLKLQSGDRLQLTFQCSESDEAGQSVLKRITYGYTWTAGRWSEEPYSSLEWQWHHDRAMLGEFRAFI
jgi:hypothetical protein